MYDFCINGGGMVGSALALGLAQQGHRVAVIEHQRPQPFAADQTPDIRVSAISLASVNVLKKLGAWQVIEQWRSRAYTGLSVWESDSARTDFDAELLGEPHLGYFVENRLVQLGCHQVLNTLPNADCFFDTQVASSQRDGQCMAVSLKNGDTLTCRFLVGADGARSVVRELAGVGTSGWQYAQHALGIIAQFDLPVAPVTWQQFWPQGPRALLPMYDNMASLIWYDNKATVEELNRLENRALKERLSQAFLQLDTQTNDFKVLNKARFPLTRSHATHYVKPGYILVGDAAHTINPLAGQGVNLGFKDVATLLDVTQETPPGHAGFYRALQAQYATPRRRDNLMMMTAMDAFYLTFSNNITPLKFIREGALKLAQVVTPAKREVLKYATGLK